MKKTAIVLVISLIVLPVAAAKMQAFVDFDRTADFSAIRTFAYYETLATSVVDDAPPVHEMIKLLIITRLKKSGLEMVAEDENPDVLVTYHTDSNQAMRMNDTLYQYHYSAGWWWSPLWGSGMDISSYSQGTLIVDVWRPDDQVLIWRGSVIGAVPDNPSPKKAQKTIEKALDKIAAEWHKQYKLAQKQAAKNPAN
jgi:hypothetical protein